MDTHENPDIEVVDEEKEKARYEPSVEDAKAFIGQSLGIPFEEINWKLFEYGVDRSPFGKGPDEVRFKTKGENDVRLRCVFSRLKKEPSFNDLVVDEFEPIPDTDSTWQKTFRVDTRGIHLLIRKLEGENLTEGRETLRISSNLKTGFARGIRVPEGLVSASEQEKKEFLLSGIRKIFAKNGIIDNKPGTDIDAFPSSVRGTDTPLLKPEN